MNTKFKKLIQELIDKVNSDQFCWEHIALLLVYLRPFIKNKPHLFDLTNFVPHGDVRDSGESMNHIRSYLDNFISVAESKTGGTIQGKPAVFSKELIVDELFAALDEIQIIYDKPKIQENEHIILDSILKIVDETVFDFSIKKNNRNPSDLDKKLSICVNECLLERVDENTVTFFSDFKICAMV